MKSIHAFLAMLLLLGLGALAGPGPEREVLYQVSILDALLGGGYAGVTTVAELKKRGDLGIGTFHGLDGEMVMDQGVVYQVKHSGQVLIATDDQTSPFAVATFLDPDLTFDLTNLAGMADLIQNLESRLEAKNHFYAVRVEGEFDYVKTRSVPAQTPPYPVLAEVLKKQSEFELHQVRGVIIGFYCPAYLKAVNLPGFHLHFISADKKSGGHLLDLKIKTARVLLDQTPDLFLELPKTEEFQKTHFGDQAPTDRPLEKK